MSFDKAVSAVYDDLVSVLQALKKLDLEFRDPAANGLLNKMCTVNFAGVVYILHAILPKLSALSKCFEKGAVNFPTLAHP